MFRYRQFSNSKMFRSKQFFYKFSIIFDLPHITAVILRNKILPIIQSSKVYNFYTNK